MPSSKQVSPGCFTCLWPCAATPWHCLVFHMHVRGMLWMNELLLLSSHLAEGPWASTPSASLSMSLACAMLWRMFCRAPGHGTCTQGAPERVFSWAELFCPPCMCRRAFRSEKSTTADLQKGCLKRWCWCLGVTKRVLRAGKFGKLTPAPRLLKPSCPSFLEHRHGASKALSQKPHKRHGQLKTERA